MMKYYSKLKRNELSSHDKTWKNLKCIVLRSPSKRLYTVSFQLDDNVEKVKLKIEQKDQGLPKVWGRGGKGRRESAAVKHWDFQSNQIILSDDVMLDTRHDTFVKNCRTIQHKDWILK
jgi:hypothetical protein